MTNEQTPLFAVVKWGDGTSDLAQLPPSGMYDDMVQDKYVRYSDYAALEEERDQADEVSRENIRQWREYKAEVERLRAAIAERNEMIFKKHEITFTYYGGCKCDICEEHRRALTDTEGVNDA